MSLYLRYVGFTLLLLTSVTGFSQKKILSPEVYDSWKRIGEVTLSANGLYSAYTITPQKGDGYLYIVNNETGKKDSIARGMRPHFSANTTYLAFQINPGFDTLHAVELKKTPKDKWPKDSLGIWFLGNDSLVKIPNIKEVKYSAESDWLAYLSHSNNWPKNYLSKKELKKEKKSERKKGKFKTDGKLLTIWHPEQRKSVCIKNVSEFHINKTGENIVFIEHEKAKKDSLRLGVIATKNNEIWKNGKRYISFEGLNFSENNKLLTGLYSADTNESKIWALWTLNLESNVFTTLLDTAKRFEGTRSISSNFIPQFINNDSKIYFGVWNAPEPVLKDTLLDREKSKVDVWSWKDDRIQPQQLTELKRELEKYNLYVLDLKTNEAVQLGRDTLSFGINTKNTQKYLLASSDESYRFQSWKTPNMEDFYRISVKDGSVIPLRLQTYFGGRLSPNGTYFSYWNEVTKQYYAMNAEDQTEKCVSCGVRGNWIEDVNGMPMMAGPRGVIGWTQNETGMLLNTEHDILYFDHQTGKTTSITTILRSEAKDTNYNYSIYNLNRDSVCFFPEFSVLKQFNCTDKSEKLFRISGSFPNVNYTLITGSNHTFDGMQKAKKSDRILFQKSNLMDYPDAFVTGNAGTEPKKISATNPQQSEYNWATVELIKWNSYSGIPLSGLVYKPENFDPNKEYPLLVYFYELYSDELHNHYAPKPTASIIFPTEYASAGYIILIPDIRYQPGHPANGAYDCIMSGTDAVMKKYPNIDPKRLGLQGQSWGGYQTAQLITMTDRYAAAMAGAPVSNMFSAYGGIRWGSGFSRQFQYEHTQSRIGKTIWEAPELYVENSPLFNLPKVKTPLLIMHNDADGAVPWYQGVELFMGLRRLQKPVWLLNYNGDDHNLMKIPNRVDLSIRMRQFFDFYLLGAPEPAWLRNGIPAVEKGKFNRYELLDGQ